MSANEVRLQGDVEVVGSTGALDAVEAPAGRGSIPSIALGRRLSLRLGIVTVLAITALFYLPALRCGYMIDDFYQRIALGELPELYRSRLDLFGLIRGPEDVALYKTFGLVPWWASSALRIDFFRPIPSVTHWLDFTLFGWRPEAAHVTSIVWYLLSVVVAWRLLARFLPAGSAILGVAVAMFALDDAHALNVIWISNRNETIAGIFVMLAFLQYLRWRESRRLRDAALTVLAQAAALLSKESAVILPLFVALHIALFPAESPAVGPSPLARLRAESRLLLGLFGLTLGYVAIYFLNGHGAASLYYVNPLRDPALWAAHFLRSGFFHAVILATGVPLLVLSNRPVTDYPAPAALLALITLGFFVIAWRWLRKERAFWFFIGWMLIGQAILTTSFPDPRLLFLPSVGFFWIVARMMQESYARWQSSSMARWVLGSLVVAHLLVAPVLSQACIFIVRDFQNGFGELRRALQANVPYAALPEPGINVFFVNYHQREASTLFGLHLRKDLPTGVSDYRQITSLNAPWREKIRRGLSAERVHYYQLSLLGKDADVEVTGERTLRVRAADGRYFPSCFEQLWMTNKYFRVGQTFQAGPF
ncbi:MAG TPA: glycosyltransferase family 39 protein, partial [Polyangiaceae bacterium]